MPELPEVETVRRGLAPHLEGERIANVLVRERRLRWPIPKGLEGRVGGQRIEAVARRGKYLLFTLGGGKGPGTLIVHLGMSGSLRLVEPRTPAARHDHADLLLERGAVLRFTDPRRFGAILWTDAPVDAHPLLRHLGPEPLARGWGGEDLFARSRGRKVPVKTFLMDSRIVVGVGNIYANEALFAAGIHPARAAGAISARRYAGLADAVRCVLTAAIEQGGTTLRDFVGGDGKPGYFAQRLAVYGRSGEPCPRCGRPLRQMRQAQRSTYYCPSCQR